MVDALLTNSRLPRSILVPALAGNERIKPAIADATAAGYGFLFFRDACLIGRHKRPDRPVGG
jgi:S-adenosylmethionine:tRNA-ribosyltransferase-isomerase (queuine synthetase)